MIKKRPSTAREVAAFTLFSMEEEQAWSDGALNEYLLRAKLPDRDAGLATHITYGVLQQQSMLDFYISHFSSVRLKKISARVLICLRMAVYQLVYMERIPVHAAVNETVGLIEKYGHANEKTIGFANAVLRSIARAFEQKSLPVLNCDTKEEFYSKFYNHNLWLVQELSEQYGQKESGNICKANNMNAPLSVRVNRLKTTIAQAMEKLESAGFEPKVHENIENLILCTSGDITKQDFFADGDVTIQDGASIVCVDVLDPTENSTIVDCCAAPGGKSFYIAEKIKNNGKIVSCDIYENKLDKIKTGAKRLQLDCIETKVADGTVKQKELVDFADYVMCDVPCSGFGIIRKKPEIRFKSDEETKDLPKIQIDILQNCSSYVKIGGTLIYSTCTILKRENQDVVKAFLDKNPNFEAVPFTHKACGECIDGMITLLPHINNTDGFFIAKLRRKS